jgi:signal transduction histidine kinase
LPLCHGGNIAGTIIGTSLDVVIVKEAVDLHAGTIVVESQLGFGTRFTVRIKSFNERGI